MIANSETFEKLPGFIDRGSYQLTLLRRVGPIALFARWNRDINRTSSFEVVRICRAPAGELFGRPLPPREVYPSTSQWGQDGWTYQHKGGAVQRFDALTAK